MRKPAVEQGRFQAQVVPLFTGTLRLCDAAGATVAQRPAAPTGIVKLEAPLAAADWKLMALDGRGQTIGTVDSAGKLTLGAPQIPPRTVDRPQVAGFVHLPPAEEARIEAFLADRDFAVRVDFKAPDAERELAERIARQFGVGLCYNNPRNPPMKALLVGDAVQSETVRDAGLMLDGVTAQWPGPGKGLIALYDNEPASQRPLLLVAGSDRAGAARAGDRFLAAIRREGAAPRRLSAVGFHARARIFPFTPAPRPRRKRSPSRRRGTSTKWPRWRSRPTKISRASR